MFTEARSDVNQSNWFRDGETMIASDSNYTLSNTSICQQMTWPLTYDDGINLHPKLCSDEAFYICQIKRKSFFKSSICLVATCPTVKGKSSTQKPLDIILLKLRRIIADW